MKAEATAIANAQLLADTMNVKLLSVANTHSMEPAASDLAPDSFALLGRSHERPFFLPGSTWAFLYPLRGDLRLTRFRYTDVSAALLASRLAFYSWGDFTVRLLQRSWLLPALCWAVLSLLSTTASAAVGGTVGIDGSCPQTAVGGEASCGRLYYINTVRSTVVDVPQAYEYSSAPQFANDFEVRPPAADNTQCSVRTTLNYDQRCYYGYVWFTPQGSGARSALIVVNRQDGTWSSASLSGTTPNYTWQLSTWSPAAGCSASLSQSRAVTCKDSSGNTAPDNACSQPKPATTQTVENYASCAFSWETSTWSASSSTCSAATSQTRSVWCERSDGPTVADSSCVGPKPASSQTVADFSGCSYNWIASGFGACSGGTGDWVLGTWSPTLGCGQVEQTREVTCAVDLNSGSRSQTVGCRRSDGVDVTDSFCDAQTRPATTEACTPSQSVCVNPPSSMQTATLDTSCAGGTIQQVCELTPEKDFCIVVPLR